MKASSWGRPRSWPQRGTKDSKRGDGRREQPSGTPAASRIWSDSAWSSGVITGSSSLLCFLCFFVAEPASSMRLGRLPNWPQRSTKVSKRETADESSQVAHLRLPSCGSGHCAFLVAGHRVHSSGDCVVEPKASFRMYLRICSLGEPKLISRPSSIREERR